MNNEIIYVIVRVSFILMGHDLDNLERVNTIISCSCRHYLFVIPPPRSPPPPHTIPPDLSLSLQSKFWHVRIASIPSSLLSSCFQGCWASETRFPCHEIWGFGVRL
jgi:hypothetical protein